MKSTKGKKIAVFDAETDPFKQDRIPAPFTCAFYDGSLYLPFWGEDCVARCLEAVAELDDEYLIYAHNGGKFDFWFMLDWVDDHESPFIINGRLVEFSMVGTKNVFRDSLSIIPVPLSAYQKEEIDYSIFESGPRDVPANRVRIQNYLKSDCINLYELVSKFSAQFALGGNTPISIGQASIRELIALHPFQVMTEASDKELRPWYMGGRVQCFRAGVVEGPWKVYDANSMYSAVMEKYEHPLSDLWESLDHPPRSKRAVWFAEFKGRNRQAIPVNTHAEGYQGDFRQTGLNFALQQGSFFACSHELVPALAAGLVFIDEWIKILRPLEQGTFDKFVHKWNREKIDAEQRGDKAGRLFAKLILNSAYGKTGQDPSAFKDYKILRNIMQDHRLREDGYEPNVRISEDPFIEIWSRKAPFHGHGFYNVSIAASVTSAARAVLLAALQLADEPIYCDTDSIVCRDFKGHTDPVELGAWKLEAEAQFAAIAGKKLYCLFDRVPVPEKKYPMGKCGRIWPVKWASKGGDLTPSEIVKIAKGGTVEKTAEVPSFSLSRGISFTTRKFRKTVAEPQKFKYI